jgi:ABC-type multidrug transport system fused ATPase/permease subunit
VFQLRVASSLYWTSVTDGLYLQDAWMGLIKPFVLGFAIVTIGCSRRDADERRHAGRRTLDHAGRRGRVGGGDCRGSLRRTSCSTDGNVLTRRHGAPARRRRPTADVELRHVSLAFDDKVVLRDVSFTLLPGTRS